MAKIDAIRKILFIDNYGHIEKLSKVAETTGHKAFSHNGEIYIKDPGDNDIWIKTVFTLRDFE